MVRPTAATDAARNAAAPARTVSGAPIRRRTPQPSARPRGAKMPAIDTAFNGPKNCSRIKPATIAARTAGRTVEERAVDLLRRLVSGVGKQGKLSRALDRDRQHPLVTGAVSRHPARQDLAPLGDKPAQPGNVLVVDERGFLRAK